MAAIIFDNHNNSPDFEFYSKMQSGVLNLFDKFEEILTSFKGSFKISIDYFQSKIQYIKAPGEVPNSQYLEFLLLFLNKKLLQISGTLHSSVPLAPSAMSK
jgi:hypothetical protein